MQFQKRAATFILILPLLAVAACAGFTTDTPATAALISSVTATKTSQPASTRTSKPTLNPTARPAPTSTPTPIPPSTQAPAPTPTSDPVEMITGMSQPRTYATYPSPDGQWQAEVVIYDCAPINNQESVAYEQLKLVDVQNQIETMVDSQLQYCGGLGAAGLDGLFWSPNSQYFYYTNAREGVPDGCGYWERPVIRFDLSNQRVEKLGGGPRSPDGTKLALWQGRDLVVWDLNGAEVGRTPAVVPEAELGPIVWAPNSQKLAYLQVAAFCPPAGFSYLVELDLADLQPELLLESEAPRFDRLAWDTLDQIRLFDEAGNAWRYTPTTTAFESTVDAIDVQDNYAYLNVGPILVILDVSDPRAPRPLGSTRLPVETVADITVHDGVAYVAAVESGLRIVDVSNPGHPREVGAYHPPLIGGVQPNYSFSGPLPTFRFYYSQGVSTVAVGHAGDQVYAYVAALGAGLRVVEVSDPTKPVEVGFLATPEGGGIVDVAIANNQAYLVNPDVDVGLQIVDISEPTSPQVIGSSFHGWGFAISHDQEGRPYVYVAHGSCSSIATECVGGMHIIDVTHAAAPQTFRNEPLVDFSTDLAVSQQHAYVLTSNGVSVLNITDPTQPQVETYNALVPASDITVAGEMLYLATGIWGEAEGLQIFDLANPAAPRLVSQWQPGVEPSPDFADEPIQAEPTVEPIPEEPTVNPEPTDEPTQEDGQK